MKSIANDTNAAALDSGYNVLKLFIENSDLAARYASRPAMLFPDSFSRMRKELLVPLIEKGLTSTRTSTKTKAQDLLLSYVYIDKPDPVIVRLSKIIDN